MTYTTGEKESITKWRHSTNYTASEIHLNLPLSNFFQLGFAMMINKFHSQLIGYVGLDLCKMIFTHRQFYGNLLLLIDQGPFGTIDYLQRQWKSLSRSNLINSFFYCIKFYLNNLTIETKPGTRGRSPRQAEDPECSRRVSEANPGAERRVVSLWSGKFPLLFSQHIIIVVLF